MSKVREYTVLASQMVTPTTLVVTLHDSKKRLPFAYEPGQYAAITFFHKGRPSPARCFSMTSSPTEQDYLQFAMRVAGEFTTSAEQYLTEGAKVIVEGPFGSFAFNSERDTSALMLAGGIGVTPFISMLRYAARMQLTNDLMLVYSCHTQDDIPFLPELDEMAAVNPHLHVVYAIGSGPTDKLQGRSVIKGHLDGPMLDRITSKVYTGRTYFVCGPAGFMNSVSDALIKNGAPEENVLSEAFSQGDQSDRSIKHNAPLQVYALTGLSVILGTGTLLVNDVAATAPKLPATNNSTTQFSTSKRNSRQEMLSQTINSLQGTNSGTTTPDTGTTTTPTTGSASTQVTVNSGGTNKTSTSSTSTTKSSTPPSSGGSSSGGTSSGSGGSTSGSGSGTGSGTGSGSGSGSGSGGTTTPPPPPAPVAPTVTLSASSTSITSGQSVTLSWHINSNATTPVTCTASGGWSGTKSTSGSTTVKPSSTTTYKLTCSNTAGSNAKSVTINVAPACVSTPSNPC